MTDRDESSKGFLARWSRKKIDAERDAPAPAEADAKDASPAAEVRLHRVHLRSADGVVGLLTCHVLALQARP